MPIRAMVKHARERPRRAEAGEASLSRHRQSQSVIRGRAPNAYDAASMSREPCMDGIQRVLQAGRIS